MRWIAALAVVLGLVAAAGLYFEKSELPDVVWTDDTPYCPHCRTDVNWYAIVCYTCRRAFDWVPDEVACPLCLAGADTRRLRESMQDAPDAFRHALEESLRDLALPPDVVAATIPDFILYMENVKEGDCLFCAGTGRWLAPAMMQTTTEGDDPLLTLAIGEMADRCPVCLGDGKCIGCRGDRKTEQGVEAARRDTDEAIAALGDLDPGRDDESAREYFRIARDLVARHAGTAEIFEASSLYSTGHDQADWAAARIELVRGALAFEGK